MALSGAPVGHEDHAQHACYAALHLIDALRLYTNELRLTRGVNFAVRLGINSGEVIVGRIGDDLRRRAVLLCWLGERLGTRRPGSGRLDIAPSGWTDKATIVVSLGHLRGRTGA